MTQCSDGAMVFEAPGKRQGEMDFTGGPISSDGGVLLLAAVERRLRLAERLAGCFVDHRDARRLSHPLSDLLKQRLFGLCAGYEDLVDHDRLRHDPLLAVAVGKAEPLPARRDDGELTAALAGKSTLNRLELTPVGADRDHRYKKIVGDLRGLQDVLVELYIAQQPTAPTEIVLDVDATDDPLHGHQWGRFFHGYYDHYCYLPLYIFVGDHPLLALLRPADIDGAAGLLKQLERIVAKLRAAWPHVRLLVRGDSGFCREHILAWCEAHGVDYLIGLAKNKRLARMIGRQAHAAQAQCAASGQPARVFADLDYQTKKSWSRSRRVVAKAEHLPQGPNPRFVVTSLPAADYPAPALYEERYCARGAMENRLKEQQLGLFADRTSCATMRANQLRLLLSTFAYVLLRALREYGLRDTEMAAAQADTIRLRLLKIGAQVRVSVRKVRVLLSQSYPWPALFQRVWANVTAWAATAEQVALPVAFSSA